MKWFPAEYEKKFLEKDIVAEAAAKAGKKSRNTQLLSDKCMQAAG